MTRYFVAMRGRRCLACSETASCEVLGAADTPEVVFAFLAEPFTFRPIRAQCCLRPLLLIASPLGRRFSRPVAPRRPPRNPPEEPLLPYVARPKRDILATVQRKSEHSEGLANFRQAAGWRICDCSSFRLICCKFRRSSSLCANCHLLVWCLFRTSERLRARIGKQSLIRHGPA